MHCTCITALDELDDYEERWEALRTSCQGPIYSTYGLSKAWLEVFHDFASPRIILVEEGGDLVGAAPLYLRSSRTAGIPVKTLSLVGEGGRFGYNEVSILTGPDRNDVVDRITAEVSGIDWNILRTNYMKYAPQVRRFMDHFRTTSNWLEYPTMNTTYCSFPPSGDITANFQKRSREHINSRMRELQKENQVSLRPVNKDDVDKAVDVYATMHKERWKRKGGSIFHNPVNIQFLKHVLKLSLSQNFGYAYELLIDDRVAAQTFGFVENELAISYLMGMDDAYEWYSPGSLALTLTMEDLRSKGCRAIDLGAGSEPYKRRMGERTVPLEGLQAKRGMIAHLSRIADSGTMKRIDSIFGVKEKLFKNIYE